MTVLRNSKPFLDSILRGFFLARFVSVYKKGAYQASSIEIYIEAISSQRFICSLGF